jgi:hypothetical protein
MDKPGLKALLQGIIDYAGLFPPANLDLETAIQNYVRYLETSERWMLARFVIPATRLPDLSRLADRHFPAGKTLAFSVLGRPSPGRSEFFDAFQSDLEAVRDFRQAHSQQAQVEVYETPLPPGELDFQIRADNLVSQAADQLKQTGLAPFFEAPYDANWQPRAERLFGALAANPGAGFKIRTGGVQAHMVPAAEELAWALDIARKTGVPLKATAGLHHPLRHDDEEVGVKMHGFLNVFGAALLGNLHAIEKETLIQILRDEDGGNFRFDENGFSWGSLSAAPAQISDFRRSAFISFGSCSFDEPRQDLQKLGLL